MVIGYIEEKAEQLLKELSLFSVPINVAKCTDILNVIYQEVELDPDISGFFIVKQSASYICINKNDKPYRKRFTIAHELGHYLLHSKENNFFIDKVEKVMYRDSQSSTGEKLREREANAFAAALLMPKSLIEQAALNLPENTGDQFIYHMSKLFEVSEQAMAIRLTNLGMLEFGLY